MKNPLHMVICLVMLWCGTALAQNPSTRAEDEKAIRAIVVELNNGWSTGNAEPWGRHFTRDADFVALGGHYYKGGDEIRKGHETLFAGRFKNSKQRYEIQSIRFLRNDVAAVHSRGAVVPNTAEFPATMTVMPLMIFVKEKGVWLVVGISEPRQSAAAYLACRKADALTSFWSTRTMGNERIIPLKHKLGGHPIGQRKTIAWSDGWSERSAGIGR